MNYLITGVLNQTTFQSFVISNCFILWNFSNFEVFLILNYWRKSFIFSLLGMKTPYMVC